MKLILNVADCTGIKSNCIYPHEVVVTNPQEMAAAITHDHVIAKYKNNYRSIENFIEAHGYFFDNDNDFSDDPSQWITEDDLEEIFSDVDYASAPSRHNMLPKDGKSARPRQHLYFPADVCKDPARYAAVKSALQKKYPFFDDNALDAARFFFGSNVTETDIRWHEGFLQIDERTVGTLVCGMGEIDITFPVCFASARKTVYYKNDSGTWESVTLTKDTSKASLSLANDRYLIINTDRYYNCFDIVDHTLHHFASDWNDRVILETDATFDDIPNTFAGYIENCEQYLYTSAQGSNYVLMNTPFISTLFGANNGMIPKKLKAINPKAIAGYTPNNQDIDVYYDRSSTDSNGPKYKCSLDMENDKYITYINAVLTGQRYAYDSMVLIPSIFAKFINGFINQGIIVDNGHSYVQLFANTSKPIFAINWASQLEGG